jgi:surface antigen
VQTIVNTGAPSAQAAGAVSGAPLSPWPPSNAYAAVPGYGAYSMNDVGGYYYWAFGQCTWWAQYERKDENLMHMGNAQYWASVAASRGYHVSWTPRVGATVVFQPGVQGAGGAGHVAHVVKVYPDNWFLVSEMNFYWNGGGWGRVDYRFAHAGGGVQFIY